MKKILLTTLLAVIGVGLFAQKLDKAKDLFNAKPPKLAEAKAEIDKVLDDPKNQKVPEAWYFKGKIYGAIAMDNTLGAQTPDARSVSFEALKKYAEIDDKQLILLTIDKFQPIMDLYQGYYKIGAAQYNENKHADAYDNFKNCLSVGEYMASKGWTNVKLDTSVVLYTGISAEKAGLRDDAAIYYSKIANAKMKGDGMVEIYKWLADYYARKKDDLNSKKYVELGKELYPSNPFWGEFELDQLKDDKKALFAKYDEILTAHPNDTTALYNYAVELYLYSYDPDPTKRPANSDDYIVKAEEKFKKLLELNPNNANAILVLGQIAYNKGVDLNAQMKLIRPPAGGKLKPEELKKKEDLRAQAGKKFDDAIPYFEKVDNILGSQGKLKMEARKTLKDALDLLITIYDSRGLKDKVKTYEDKFNNVDKAH